MKRVLVLVFSNLKHDARVARQVGWLTKRHHVTLVCFDADDQMAPEIIRVKQTRLTPARKAALGAALIARQFNTAFSLLHDYEETICGLRQRSWDIVIANDIDTLPIAFDLKKDGKVIFDAHEYAPRHFEDKLIWRTFFQPLYLHLCKKYIPLTDGMLTVGKGLADEYAKNFGVSPVIITNAAKYHDIAASEVATDKVRLIHHGIANSSRRLEMMLEMMDVLDSRFTLDLILMTSEFASGQTKLYIESLKEKALQNPRIRILPAVKSADVVSTINKYDMGVFIIPPINFNYANTLPNKLFDFIQARLGIAIGPTPEMASIVNRFNLGVVGDDFTARSVGEKLNALTYLDIQKFKANSSIAAQELNAEKNEALFNALIDSLP
jgi:hypothetical protein